DDHVERACWNGRRGELRHVTTSTPRTRRSSTTPDTTTSSTTRANETTTGESYLGGRRKIAVPICVRSADSEIQDTPGRPSPGRVWNAPSANVSTPQSADVKKNRPV